MDGQYYASITLQRLIASNCQNPPLNPVDNAQPKDRQAGTDMINKISRKNISRIVSIVEWLKFQTNRILILYCKMILANKAKSVGKDVEFRAHWHHFASPPIFVGNGDIEIGDNVIFFGTTHFACGKQYNPDCTIKIGNHVLLSNNVSIRCLKGVEIGDRCIIASGVRIFDQNGHPLSPELRRLGWDGGAFVPDEEIKPIVIEENVWIGENAQIHPGVRIGKNSIISAGSSVTKNVPPNVIVMGSPARVCFWLDRDTKGTANKDEEASSPPGSSAQ